MRLKFKLTHLLPANGTTGEAERIRYITLRDETARRAEDVPLPFLSEGASDRLGKRGPRAMLLPLLLLDAADLRMRIPEVGQAVNLLTPFRRGGVFPNESCLGP